ncbi:MAG: dihydropteroate synthase [Desulfobacteraceae bacterium]|nr:dihydropteroate synthase [Desulfobacteraceae bacterium]
MALIEAMIIVADNLHVIQPAIAKAVQTLDPAPIRELALRCIQAGAQALDINSGPLSKMPQERMRFLVESVQTVTDLPLILDTTNATAMAAGLEACRGRATINGFSLEPAKIERMLPLARQFDADIIGYLLGANSQVPVEADEMMAVAVALFEQYTQAGLDPARLIIDPVIAPLSWQEGARHNQAVLKVIAGLPDLLGTPVRTIAGLSNLATGRLPLERKITLEQTFLPMLAAAGLDMVLTNVLHAPTLQTARLCDQLLGDRIFA